MKEISKLLEVRESVRVVDATLRDGGLVNDFYFTDEFAKALYETNVKAGVDYMEMGYRADKEQFDPDKFGPWKFSSDEYIRKIVGDNNTDLKIAIMADVGRCNYKEDIHDKAESPVDMIRVATYLHQLPGAVAMIEDACKKGYETTCNIMAISTAGKEDVSAALDIICQTPISCVYIVDSYGSLYPEQIQRIADLYCNKAAKYGKKVGIHAHDNQKLAFANTIEAVGDEVDYLDGTYNSMGRGAGNCAMELLLGFLKNPKYKERYAFEFVEKYMLPLKESGVVWGYDLQYLVTGLLNQHPRTAIQFTKDERKDYLNFYQEMINLD
ncbi:MAG: aldolase catalytic domain-containing protein [Pseudobutyrivibrio sp.]|nr:aldolase catalytic domain-containing protein [Pseudobutyrivibrio sp.]